MTAPVLLTERLLLRPLGPEDAEAWYAFHADPVTMRHPGGVQSRSFAWRCLCAMAGEWSIRGSSMLAVTLREVATATIDYAVDVLGGTDIIHTIAPENAESIALAQRLGSTNRGRTTLPPPLESLRVVDWGQSATDWRARRAGLG